MVQIALRLSRAENLRRALQILARKIHIPAIALKFDIPKRRPHEKRKLARVHALPRKILFKLVIFTPAVIINIVKFR